MNSEDDILDLLKAETIKAETRNKRALIIQSGAIGDCILTLPLAAFIKNSLNLGSVELMSHTEYTGIFPGRTCIDSVNSIDLIEIHRLFKDSKDFHLADRDPLIKSFLGYSWIITFLGKPGSNFENNLIFTTNCNHYSEIITLLSQSPDKEPEHISTFFIKQFASQSNITEIPLQVFENCQIKATKNDIKKGRELLWEYGLESQKKLVIIQPGSGAAEKCWNLANFISIAKELRSRNIQTAFLLGPAEIERFDSITIEILRNTANCLFDLSLSDVLQVLSNTDVFVGNDSGITHLAAAMGKKVIVLFGPTNPAVYKPLGPDVTVYIDKNENFSKKPSIELRREIINFLFSNILAS